VLAAMVAINAAEIAYRFLFTRGLNWVQELSIILAMALYFFVYALIAKDREYIRIELVARLFGPRGRRWLALATRLVVLVFQAMVAWFAFRSAQFAALFETPVLGWPEWVLMAPLAAGCADIVVTEAIYLVWQLRGIEVVDERAGIVT
jgi:TRAP-type C4-dicarboxylate transport system permease small subunit